MFLLTFLRFFSDCGIGVNGLKNSEDFKPEFLSKEITENLANIILKENKNEKNK